MFPSSKLRTTCLHYCWSIRINNYVQFASLLTFSWHFIQILFSCRLIFALSWFFIRIFCNGLIFSGNFIWTLLNSRFLLNYTGKLWERFVRKYWVTSWCLCRICIIATAADYVTKNWPLSIYIYFIIIEFLWLYYLIYK